MSRVLEPCGTPAAYRRHRRRGEDPCDLCRGAKREESQAKRAGAPARPRKPRKLAPCGTKSARQRHRRYGETCPVCDAPKPLAPPTKPTPKPATRRAGNRDVANTAWMWGPVPTLNPAVAARAATTVTRHVPAHDVPAVLAALGIEQENAA